MREVKVVKAPWSDSFVKQLNEHQVNPMVHPYTCRSGKRKDAAHKDGEGVLVATRDGWKCPYCTYTQDWA